MKIRYLLLIGFLLTTHVVGVHANPTTTATPAPTPTDEPAEDYETLKVSMKSSGSGNPVGGTSKGISIYFCPWFITIPLSKTLLVPQGGLQDCVMIKGFPQYCPWPYFYRVKVSVLQQPRFGATVTASPQGFAWNTISACFNVNMDNSSKSNDFFIYKIEYPRSIWGGWLFWWPKTYYRMGVMKITKQGVY